MCNVLFICSANKDRSVTAEDRCRLYYNHHDYASAGLNPKEIKKNKTTLATQSMLRKADVIYVMTQHHQELIENFLEKQQHNDLLYEVRQKMFVLHIPDEYPYGDTSLVLHLEDKLGHILDNTLTKDVIKASQKAFKEIV